MKRFTFVLLVAALIFSVVVKPTESFAQESAIENIENGHVESFFDSEGNKTELEYLYDENELRVNTYVNGELADFTTRESIGENEYSEEMVYTQVLDVKNVKKPKKVKKVKEYKVKDFVTEANEPTFTTSSVTLMRPYPYIKSKYNSTLKLTGYLYGTSQTSTIKKFMFDFKRDVALSVVAAAITTVFASVIVAVTVLLTSLGVSFGLTSLTDSLNGYYDATRKRYSYYVTVKGKETYSHNQEQIDVYYYNSKNGKKNTRVKRSGSWMSEDAILNVGIISY
ncbi:hypothetical protein [Bacillus sp. MMSF_3328]|uniref:hypothetical protein n=1 Tax=Bacillus sp. MMSF_3328 TaxID=3047080 RepID=UPI00273DE493|nr:hypothetical protein [Bacillus sp. MMSF_3328]